MSEPTTSTETAPAGTETQSGEAAQPAEVDWQAEAKKWEKRSKDNYAKLKEAEPKLAEYEQIVASRKTEAEKQAEELARWQSEAETWRKTAVGSRIEALAATSFADPSDAVSALDPAKYLDAGGQINDKAIVADLEDVLTRKPHWRRAETPATPRIPAPNPAQGTSGAAPTSDPASQFAAILQGRLNGSR